MNREQRTPWRRRPPESLKGDIAMNKMFLVLVSATFPITAVNAQVQVAPPATGASSGQAVTPQGSPSVKESRTGWGSAQGHGRGSAGVTPSGSAHASVPKSGSGASQAPGNPQ